MRPNRDIICETDHLVYRFRDACQDVPSAETCRTALAAGCPKRYLTAPIRNQLAADNTSPQRERG
jgi:hypothetical protein